MNHNQTSSQGGHAAGRDVTVDESRRSVVRHIHGGTNIIGSQEVVHITINQHAAPRTRVVVHDFDEALHITPEQRLQLVELRDQWITLHTTMRKMPLTYAAAQSRINKAAGATSYKLIRKDRFELAMGFIRQQMAILSNMASAPRKDDDWRPKKIGAIKARCAKQFGGVDIYKPYIKAKFGADSLTDLATDELQQTYVYVMGKKSSRS